MNFKIQSSNAKCFGIKAFVIDLTLIIGYLNVYDLAFNLLSDM